MTDLAPTDSATSDVTVIVTCFNHQAHVEQCLDSLAHQTLPPRQVIVIDDSSRDDSANVIQRWLNDHRNGFSFIKHERNRGLCASLNEALTLAEERYLCHLSADDWVETDRFERQVAAFDKSDEGSAIILGDLREVDAGGGTIVDHDFGKRLGRMTGPEMQSGLLTWLLEENNIPAPAVLMRTDMVREIGGYDESLSFEDYDLWLRLAVNHSISYEPGIVTNYRIVNSGLTRDPSSRASMLCSEANMLAKHIGTGDEHDSIIERRLLRIGGEILRLGALGPLREVLAHLGALSDESWIRNAIQATTARGGLALLNKNHAERLGLVMLEEQAKS